MRIFFDPDFDAGFWPGPLPPDSAKKASVGEAWVGPYILLSILETALGQGGLYPSQSERTISLAKTVCSEKGFWSASADQDPIGVARTLLRWIDWLKFHSWNGQPPSSSSSAPRIADLANIAPSVLPSAADRLNAILSVLPKRQPDIQSITSFEPIDHLLPLWQRVFAALASRGVSIGYSPPPAAQSPASDLRRALARPFSPTDDGSLVLFRPSNPLDAAERISAWLWSFGPNPLSDTIVISPSPALDESLRRFGLPMTGAREASNDASHLQILPLVLAMGWNPPDPQRALELLLLPESPIPGFIARSLRSALQQWPAVGSPDWKKAIETCLAKVTDPSDRQNIRERLDLIFRIDAPIRAPYPASALKLRSQFLKKWAAARRHALPDSEPSTPSTALRLDAIIAQCALFEKLLELYGSPSLSETLLHKLNAEVADSLSSSRRYEPQAGIATVPSPGALAGPARRVVWWDFTLESAPSPFSIPFSRAELAAIDSQGVHLTPPSSLASRQADRWRRPFLSAAETLILVCPQFGEDGEARHHHPLWDEVTANKTKSANLDPLIKKALHPARPVPTRLDPYLPIPAPRRSWAISPALVHPPPTHSPTSLSDLIGCPFKWALSRLARLSDPEIAALAGNDRLLGNLSHKILEEVLLAAPADGASARSLAIRFFNSLGPTLAAPLFLPGAPVQLAHARKATADAACDIVTILKNAGLPVAHLEHLASRKTSPSAPIELNGRLDLVAGSDDSPVVIDLKWSGESYHRDHLKNGTATQLAAYAFLMKSGRRFPPVAFFIIRNQRLLSLPDSPFKPGAAEIIDGPPIHDTWDAFLRTSLERLAAVQTGHLDALGIPLPGDEKNKSVASKDELAGSEITLTPPCTFCSFGYLCGRSWETS